MWDCSFLPLTLSMLHTWALRGPCSSFVFGEMRDYVAEWRQRGDWVRFPRGDSRSWWPRWNMKALCASAPNGNTRGVRSSPHHFMMDTFPPSRSGCHEDDEWLPSASAARGGMWQSGGPPQLPPSFTHLFFVFTSPILLHRAMESLSSSLRWPAWRFSHKSPAAVKPDGRHTSWALPVTNRKWPACHGLTWFILEEIRSVRQSCPLACAGNELEPFVFLHQLCHQW